MSTHATAHRAAFVGWGEKNAMVCLPSNWSQQEAIEFAKQNDQRGRDWRIVSNFRVPCDCRANFCHLELEAA